ncbi:FkbM family methyltransferase [Roseimaritima ulvae]|uniref:2-O-methyltransferase NoeI n=1 Tax=Roseimaritima ulvae TaxID=980254 RepID=A0A5B9QZA2_9BACT|nr:FkbM family methyltransferase [Roseimaritima ulvae]QEG42506.1 2-O-methyltransferase NoeI [Roseimaritima ulvae]
MIKYALPPVAAYLRHCPIDCGKWRLERKAVNWARTAGHQMGEKTVRTRQHFRMSLCLNDWVDQHIYATGQYEPEVIRVAQSILGPGDVAVDIGANIGFFSLLFASCTGRQGKVISFEAQPNVFQRLSRNRDLNPGLIIELNQVAAAGVNGTLEFHCGPEEHSGVGSLRNRGTANQIISVQSVRCDDMLANIESIRLIKIDVEGAESQVLAGLNATLTRCHPELLVEVSDHYLKQCGSSAEQLYCTLQQLGYQMIRLSHDRNELVDGRNDQLPIQFNALFTTRKQVIDDVLMMRS